MGGGGGSNSSSGGSVSGGTTPLGGGAGAGGGGGGGGSASLSVFVDGVLVDGPHACGYPTAPGPVADGQGYFTTWIGHRARLARPSALVWDLGPAWLLDRVLDLVRINAAYNVGPRYPGVFAGPLQQYFTPETVDAVNLRLVGQRADAVDQRHGHTVFSPPAMDISADRVLGVVHPWFTTAFSSDAAVLFPTIASLASPQLERAFALVRGAFVTLPGGGLAEAIRRNTGVASVLRLVDVADDTATLASSLGLLAALTKYNPRAASEMTAMTGYRYELVARALKAKKELITPAIVTTLLFMAGKLPDNRRYGAARISARHRVSGRGHSGGEVAMAHGSFVGCSRCPPRPLPIPPARWPRAAASRRDGPCGRT